MSLSNAERGTLDYYNQNAGDFKKFRGEGVSPYWSSEIKRLQEFLPQGNILELGCGTGNEAFVLNEKGYNYHGTDFSLSMLHEARRTNPNLSFSLQNYQELGLAPSQYDGFVAFASLLHLPKEKLPGVMNDLKLFLRPHAVGLITMKEGTGEKVDDKGRHFAYYSALELASVFSEVGYAIVGYSHRPEANHNWHCFYLKT